MATNPMFNFFNFAPEQNLYEDLVVESIRQYGHDVYYLPRTGDKIDDVLNEYESISFNQALPVEVFVKNSDSFEGDGALMSKFNLEIRDQMTLNMSKRSFNEFVKPTTEKERPWEGDVIFIPMLKVWYQIKYTKSDAVFYSLGKLNMFEIVLELFENNGERFNTGVADIDALYPTRGDISDPDYDLEVEDPGAANEALETATTGVLDFSESDPFTE